MSKAVSDRGAVGQGSIMFRQDLEYPRTPGQITYYPPEPSETLRNQVKKDRGGGLALYIIGFVIVIIGYISAREFSEGIEIYSVLIPLILILGLVMAFMYLYLNNVALAKLSRAMPMILMVCLLIMYITSILMAIMDLSNLGEEVSENAVTEAFENLMSSLLNPAFFLMSAGLMICRAGGTMLWTSTKIMNEFIPGMIIIESPMAEAQAPPQKQSTEQQAKEEEPKLCEHCNKPLEFIEQYGRYYCYDCQEYAPK